MVQQVPESPGLPSPPAGLPIAITTWAGNLVKVLSGIIAVLSIRLNRTLPKDGTEAMTAALPLQELTVATRPAASANEGRIIYVSDGGGGAVFQGSNGSAWVNLG